MEDVIYFSLRFHSSTPFSIATFSRAMIDTVNEVCRIKKEKKKEMIIFLCNFLFNLPCEISGKMNVTHEQR